MITKEDVLRSVQIGQMWGKGENQVAVIALRITNPAQVERVRTVLQHLWGAGMVERHGKDLEWRLTDAGKDELAGRI